MIEDIVTLVVGIGLGVAVGETGSRVLLGMLAARQYNRQIRQRMETGDLASELTQLFEKTYTSAEAEDSGS